MCRILRPGRACALVLFLLAATAASPQVRYVFRCDKGGRYTLFAVGQPEHICWDKQLYQYHSAPSYMRDYFEQKRAEQKQQQADIQQGGYTYAIKRAGERRAARESAVASAAPAASPARSVALEAAPVARPAPPPRLEREAVMAVKVGASQEEVIEKLGKPQGRISGGGDGESWTYVVTGGAFARIKLAGGKVTSVLVP